MRLESEDEMAERLAELQGGKVPRCSIALLRGDPEAVIGKKVEEFLAADPLNERVFDEHLSHYAWMVQGDQVVCPGCGAWGSFAWGLVHGRGRCTRCRWPGTLLHYLPPLPEQVNDDTVCWYCRKVRAVHAQLDDRNIEVTGGKLVCPDESQGREFRPEPAKFAMLLWAHPDEVSTRRPR